LTDGEFTMSEPFEVTVPSQCSVRRRTVKVTLQSPTPFKTKVIGKPIVCSHMNHELINMEHGEYVQVCNDDARCLLKAVRFTK
jgi:hypothetical protein